MPNRLSLSEKLLMKVLIQVMSHRQSSPDEIRAQLSSVGLTGPEIDEQGIPSSVEEEPKKVAVKKKPASGFGGKEGSDSWRPQA